jgi:GWxTD domain-containing protein
MTMLEVWMQGSSAKALGWTLVHSLWEGAAVALVLAVLLGVARSSRVRYWAACCAMVALLVGFGATLYRVMPRDAGVARQAPIPAASVIPVTEDGPMGKLGTPWEFSDLLPWLAPAWLAGVLLFQLRCLASWMAAGRLRRRGVCGVSEEWIERLDGLRARLRMARPVMLLESCFLDVPVVIGHLRPVILMPVGLLAGLPVAQIESILLHELAHIRRADYLVNLMQTLVEGLLFYHPAVWWISHVMRAERENCCDDVAVRASGDAHEYATALAALAETRWAVSEAALAANGGNLIKRIRRVLAQPEGPRAAMAPVLSAGVLVVTCGVALAAWQAPRQDGAPVAAAQPVAQESTRLGEELERLQKLTQTLEARKLSQLAQAAEAPVASPQPVQTADPKKLAEALERLRETLQKVEAGRRGQSIFLAQNSGGPVADAIPAPYRAWLNEEVVYIITAQERAAFLTLRTDDERNIFIKQFWARRDPMNPTPRSPEQYPVIAKGNPENEYKKEHYRRIKYADDRFTTKIPGWKTDRGRIYIINGPPDEIESHPSGGKYTPEGGGTVDTFPFEQWRYRWIEGIGQNVIMEFVDTTRTGEYRLTMDPHEKEVPPAKQEQASLRQLPMKVGVSYITAGPSAVLTRITVQFDTRDLRFEDKDNISTATVKIYGRISTLARRPLSPFEDVVTVRHGTADLPNFMATNPSRIYEKSLSLAPGSYRLNIAGKDLGSNNSGTHEIIFEVPQPAAQDAMFSSAGPGEKAVVVVGADKTIRAILPIDYDATRLKATLTSAGGKTIGSVGMPLQDRCEGKLEDSGCQRNYKLPLWDGLTLPTGFYNLTAVVTDSSTWTDKTYVVNFSVH